MKICHVIFSSNRLEYLEKALESHSYLNYNGIKVDRLLIDDYPFNRDDSLFEQIAKKYSINRLYLNKTNLGITKNWQYLFDIVNNDNYDYILHQEDDVRLLEKIDLQLLVDVFKLDKNLRQIQLARNNWYPEDKDNPFYPKDTDIVYKQYCYDLKNDLFPMMFSLYPSWICREPLFEELQMYPSEGTLGWYLKTKYSNLYTAIFKNKNSKSIIEHYGEYSQGRKVTEIDPGWETFKKYDPLKKYDSISGKVYTK